MKKWFLILVVCVASVSCQWYHENISSPDECAAWYFEQLYEAAEDGDVSKFESLVEDLNDWESGLSQSELKESTEGGYNYGVENPDKVEAVITFAYYHDVPLF